MTDIYSGLAILATISAALFFLGLRLSRSATTKRVTFIALATVCGIGIYIVWLDDSVLLARLLPFSNLIVLGNWFLPACAFLAGTVWRKLPGSVMRRSVYTTLLLGVGLFAVVQPIWGSPPTCHDMWRNGVCMQTSKISCSAACAATILKAVGIEANEQEMAELCLTRNGTLWQGLYRGLKLKTAGTDWDVEVFAGGESALRDREPGPVILTVGIPRGATVDPVYTEDYGWTPGEMHAALFYRFADNGNVDMGDPGIDDGREQWSREDLKVLYRRRGIRLVQR